MTSTDPHAGLPGGCIQRVPPAGALRETRWVLLAMALTLLAGALAVGWQRHLLPQERLLAHQIDLATELTAAEQGIYTDLQAVYDEWRNAGATLPPPEPRRWAADGWPPFVDDLAAQKRGRRQWRLLLVGNRYAYLGVSAEADSFALDEGGRERAPRWLLWRLPAARPERAGEGAADVRDDAHADDTDHEGFDLWLHAAEMSVEAVMPSSLDFLEDTSLIRHGWRQAAAHLNARKRSPEASLDAQDGMQGSAGGAAKP